MTQTLHADERIALDHARAIRTPASASATTETRFGTFAITFGIAFAILYTILERQNWPLFTYHPAVGKVDFWMHAARSGEGPPMYWYGWVVLSLAGAGVVGGIATMVSPRWLQRATVFCCVLAALWPIAFALANVIADRASFDAEFLRSVWIAAIPALVGAVAATYLVPVERAQRAWTGWLLIMPIGGLVILGYSLNQYFLR
jgi:hypothetical protein